MSFDDEHGLQEDPFVAEVEQVLAEAAERSGGGLPGRQGRIVADRAVWFCACASLEDTYDPTWLIHDTVDGRMGWCRVPDGTDVDDLIIASSMTGDHVASQQVLAWLLDGTDGFNHHDETGRAVAAAVRGTIDRLRAG